MRKRRRLDQDQSLREQCSTPPHITYCTPSPSAVASDYDEAEPSEEQLGLLHGSNADTRMARTDDRTSRQTMTRSSILGHHPYSQNQATLQLHAQNLRRWDYLGLVIPTVLAPPDDLLNLEHLFLVMRTYVAGSLDNGSWILRHDGWCDSRKTVQADVGTISRVYHLCSALGAFDKVGRH